MVSTFVDFHLSQGSEGDHCNFPISKFRWLYYPWHSGRAYQKSLAACVIFETGWPRWNKWPLLPGHLHGSPHKAAQKGGRSQTLIKARVSGARQESLVSWWQPERGEQTERRRPRIHRVAPGEPTPHDSLFFNNSAHEQTNWLSERTPDISPEQQSICN